MTKKKLNELKQSLLSERQEILTELMNNDEDFQQMEALSSGDLADQAFNFYEKQFLIHLSSSEKQRLEDITAALQKIDKEIFGLCELCKNPIDEKRLEAIPYAKLCMDCKTRKKRLPTHDE